MPSRSSVSILRTYYTLHREESHKTIDTSKYLIVYMKPHCIACPLLHSTINDANGRLGPFISRAACLCLAYLPPVSYPQYFFWVAAGELDFSAETPYFEEIRTSNS